MPTCLVGDRVAAGFSTCDLSSLEGDQREQHLIAEGISPATDNQNQNRLNTNTIGEVPFIRKQHPHPEQAQGSSDSGSDWDGEEGEEVVLTGDRAGDRSPNPMENGHFNPMASGGSRGAEQPEAPAMIPFLSACFAELRAKGLHEPRVFQHPTSLTEIRQLWHDICQDGVHKLKEQESPHLIAGLVVWHLKRQPEPLVPYSLYPLVVAAGAGAAAAAEESARRLQHHDELDEDERDDDDDDLEDDDEDDEASRGVPGSSEEGGGGGGVVGGGGTPVAKALAAVAAAASCSASSSKPEGAGAGESNTASEGEVASGDDSSKTSAAKQAKDGDAGAARAAALPEAAGKAAAGQLNDSITAPNSSGDATASTAAANVPGAVGSGSPGGAAAGTNAVDDRAVGQEQRTEVVPGPVWGGAGGGGVDWGGRQGVGGGGGVEAGAGAGSEVAARGVSSGEGRENSEEWGAEDGTVALQHLQNLAAQLPYGAWQVLCLLLEFLEQVAALNKVNEMTSEVLAQTFAPVLCRPKGSAFMSLRHVQDLLKIQAVVRVLIENHNILSQNRSVSNHASAGNKTLMAGQAKEGGKDGLALTLSAGGRRASSNDLYIVQQLINDSVSLLVYSESGGEGEGDESDGSSRGGGGQGGDGARASGAGRRRSRGEALGGQVGRLRSFLRPHMLHAPPPPAHYGSAGLPPSTGTGPAYLRKHSFFDLDEDEDEDEYGGAKNNVMPTGERSQEKSLGQGSDRGVTGSSATEEADAADAAAAATAAKGTVGGGRGGKGDVLASSTATMTGAAAAAAAHGDCAGKQSMAVSDSPGAGSGDSSVGGGANDAAKGAGGNAAGGAGTGGANAREGGAAGAAPLLRGGRKTVAGALERRRMMLACRTLKAQINHYEVNFQAEYGHLPRTRERAPLVSTYAQYKSWKQFIRDDASTQLQSFFRGYRERKRHPEIPRLLRNQAPPPPPPPSSSSSSINPNAAGVGGVVSPPGLTGVVAGQHVVVAGASPASPLGPGVVSAAAVGVGGGSGGGSPPPSTLAGVGAASAAPSAEKSLAAGGGVSGAGMLVGPSPSPVAVTAAAGGVSTSKSPVGGVGDGKVGAGLALGGGDGGGSGAGAVACVSAVNAADEEARVALTGKLKELLEEKRGIKSQLKHFDMSFFGRSGRLPTKVEKEPMRHLYDRYNNLKHQIRDVESLLVAHRQQHSPQLQYTPPQSPYTASPRGVWTADSGGGSVVGGNNTNNNISASVNPNTNTISAASTPNSNNNDATTPTQQRWAGTPVIGMSPSGSSARAGVVIGSPISVQSAVAASAAAAATAAVSAASAAAVAGVGDGGRSGTSGSAGAGGGTVGSGGEKLELLKKEKRVLHVMLKNFEKDFKEKHGREVSCPEDIAPVEGEYQKYKMIKKRLAQLTKP